MSRRLALLTEIISPYRIPLFNALARDPDVSLDVIFFSETDPNLRQWLVYKDDLHFRYQVLPSWRRRLGKFNVLLNRKVADALNQARPEAIICGGYSYLASWQALWWASSRNIPFLLWSESNVQDARKGHLPVEVLKQEFLRRCTGFVVPGQSARDYLLTKKIREERIFIAPNAVDNDLFGSLSAVARREANANRRKLGLPERYVLFVGRLVPEKGVFDLLRAYADLEERIRQELGLVFVGDGPARHELQNQASEISIGKIMFVGFAHREQLPSYYALAEMLVLPTYTDPWGLVVNEAMACGLPVIVTNVAGCVRDLVREGWNGLLVPPRNMASLSSAIRDLGVHPELRATMGTRATSHIANFSPQQWSVSIAAAIQKTISVAADSNIGPTP
jgi:glycosyltransferase involved in cell wall biosynthesis